MLHKRKLGWCIDCKHWRPDACLVDGASLPGRCVLGNRKPGEGRQSNHCFVSNGQAMMPLRVRGAG